MSRKLHSDTPQVDEIAARPRPHKAVRNPERPLQRWRLTIQLAFVALCLWIGVEFFFFVRYLESGGASTWVARPPGAEAFLPISSLMSLYYFFLSGQIHPAHPAGLFILVTIFLMSLTFGKTFCSWVCPFGLLSESLADFGEKIMGRRLRLPRVVDYLLRSLKYLLLGFFLYAIFFVMGEAALRAFLDSPYNQVADVKMYYFFAQISSLAFWVIAGLVLLSIFIRNFWCRFLCPYGALLGILGLLSPAKIKRNPQTCIDCTKCARVCPSLIKVDQVKTVLSDECTGCLQCVDACPVANTLQYQTTIGRRRIPKKLVPVITLSVFILVTGLAMLTGNWQNKITAAEYLRHQQYLESYGHPTDTQGLEELNEK